MADDPLSTELTTDANFDAQRYLLCCGDLADPFRDGLDPRAHFDAHGQREGRHQLAGKPAVRPEARVPGVTLCAIARNEGPYLLEWIAYHRLIGIEHIVIYSNDSDDGSDSLLARLAALGLIEHRDWPGVAGRSSQHSAYSDAAVRVSTRWIAFLDLDEFLNLKSDKSIGAFLARFDPDVSAIGINWRMFGSAGQIERAPGLVTQRFTRAAAQDAGGRVAIKSIAVASEIYKVSPHRVRVMHGRYADAAGFDLDPGRGAAPLRQEHAQINHHVIKSLAEFAAKRSRGTGALAVDDARQFSYYDDGFFAAHDRNEEADESILRWVPSILAEITRIERLLDDCEIIASLNAGIDTNFLPR